jgi:hypothetical protein
LNFPGRNPHRPYIEEHLGTVADVLGKFCEHGESDLTDGSVDALLNDSYPADMKTELDRQITYKTKRLQELFVDDWQPFGLTPSNERQELEKQWESLFDGSEVLPEELIADAKAQGSWLGAARYLVPIAGQQHGNSTTRSNGTTNFRVMLSGAPTAPGDWICTQERYPEGEQLEGNGSMLTRQDQVDDYIPASES